MYYKGGSAQEDVAGSFDSSDLLLAGKQRIFASKLEVLAGHIQKRLDIRHHNLERISSDQENLTALVDKVSRSANYGFSRRSDVNPLHTGLLRLTAERRTEDVECWRDIVLVMRDFLTTWEFHEQAKARSAFIQNVG